MEEKIINVTLVIVVIIIIALFASYFISLSNERLNFYEGRILSIESRDDGTMLLEIEVTRWWNDYVFVDKYILPKNAKIRFLSEYLKEFQVGDAVTIYTRDKKSKDEYEIVKKMTFEYRNASETTEITKD